jgi:hypothetical protein
MGGLLVRKLVKPTKDFCSWPSYEHGRGFCRSPKAKSDIRAAAAGILWEADPAVRQELGGLNPSNRVLDQLAELKTLFVGDRGTEILDLNQALSDEDDLGDFSDPAHPGIANQLWIQCQHPLRLFLVAAGSGLPLNQARCSVQVPNRVDISYEVMLL